jgi:hypothetical protein
VAIGDFNGDGKLDLVVGGFTEWTTLLYYDMRTSSGCRCR